MTDQMFGELWCPATAETRAAIVAKSVFGCNVDVDQTGAAFCGCPTKTHNHPKTRRLRKVEELDIVSLVSHMAELGYVPKVVGRIAPEGWVCSCPGVYGPAGERLTFTAVFHPISHSYGMGEDPNGVETCSMQEALAIAAVRTLLVVPDTMDYHVS